MWNLDFLVIWTLLSSAIAQKQTTKKSVTIVNDSGGPLALYWVHPTTREATLLSSPSIPLGSEFPVDSFEGHEFEIRELPDQRSGLCSSAPDQSCGVKYFVVSENNDQSKLFS
jgi:hypothetical protein